MKLILNIEREDGRIDEVRVRPKHIVKYEEQHGSIGDLGEVGVSNMFRLAHLADAPGVEFDDWIENIVDIDAAGVLDDGGDGGPKESEGKASPSPAASRAQRS